jgi:hemerythrin-like domain-containing protein
MTHALSTEIRQELMNQHASLDEALQELLRAASRVDSRPLQEAWTRFEPGLLRHLELEEQFLFPLVEGRHLEEVRALRVEHDRIRDIVGELGLCCDLHTVRKQAVERLAKMLRSHAEREDVTLYRWVDEQTPVETRRRLLRLLVNTVRSELHVNSGHGGAAASLH